MFTQIILAAVAIAALIVLFLALLAILSKINDDDPPGELSRDEAVKAAESYAEEGGVARLKMPE